MDEPGYSGGATAAAAVATILFPLIALVVALIVLAGQHDPRKRSQLRAWAWISAAWLAVATATAVLLSLY